MRWLLLLVLSLSPVLGPASVAAAQDDAARSASARAFFEEGVKLADDGQWPEAADRFRRALSLRDSQVIRFNLASALQELGKLVEASELMRQVELDPATDKGLREQARARLEALAPRIAKLTVQVDGELEGAEITLDEQPLAQAQLGLSIPTDPGEHHLRSLREGEQVDEQHVTLAEGASETVTLRTARVATPAEAAATLPVAIGAPVEHDDRQSAEGRHSKLLWWGIAGGAAVVVAAVVIGALAAGKSGDSGSKPYQGDFNPPSIPVQVGQ